ncbi:MAG: hypothetical protein U5K56_13050 [Halioglobus sp.]|nr:hypothetical protein [Halioglobus sp.]
MTLPQGRTGPTGSKSLCFIHTIRIDKAGIIWFTAAVSNKIRRFDPETETFIADPSPTRVTWLRDLVFTKDGQVCSSSSNLPAWAVEDGRPSFICIDPAGGARDRKLITGLPIIGK